MVVTENASLQDERKVATTLAQLGGAVEGMDGPAIIRLQATSGAVLTASRVRRELQQDVRRARASDGGSSFWVPLAIRAERIGSAGVARSGKGRPDRTLRQAAELLLIQHFSGWMSGTGGKQVLYNALLATLNPGDEVIVPSFTFAASAGAITWAGLRPPKSS